jgi:hypothetical protein
MKCMFELTYFYYLLTYLKTIRAKVLPGSHVLYQAEAYEA